MEIYLIISLVVIGVLGIRLYQLGLVWTLEFMTDKEQSKRINRILLVLFYLFNAGILLISVYVWNYEQAQLIYALHRIGLALIGISVLHIANTISFLIIFYFGETR